MIPCSPVYCEPVDLDNNSGYALWMHWKTSGVQMYTWDNELFFAVDLHTCKGFEPNIAIDFTKGFFQCTEIIDKCILPPQVKG